MVEVVLPLVTAAGQELVAHLPVTAVEQALAVLLLDMAVVAERVAHLQATAEEVLLPGDHPAVAPADSVVWAQVALQDSAEGLAVLEDQPEAQPEKKSPASCPRRSTSWFVSMISKPKPTECIVTGFVCSCTIRTSLNPLRFNLDRRLSIQRAVL
jgi:hypothetical protein